MHFNEAELAIRVPVWHALAELFIGRNLQNYDYRWIAQVIKNCGSNREEIFTILDQYVDKRPTMIKRVIPHAYC